MSDPRRDMRVTAMRHREWLLVLTLFVVAFGEALAADLGDPTQPPGVGAASLTGANATDEPGFSLSAVLVSEGRRIAIINGRRLRVGDVIGTAVVQSIQSDRVRLARDEGPLELELISRRVKRGFHSEAPAKAAVVPSVEPGDARSDRDAPEAADETVEDGNDATRRPTTAEVEDPEKEGLE